MRRVNARVIPTHRRPLLARRVTVRFHSVTKLSVFILAFVSLTIFADQNEQVREWYLGVDGDKATAKVDVLSYQAQYDLFKYVVEHKVAAVTPENIELYDPTGEIGYCY